MLWFEGSIPAAIASAKLQNSVFVVVITGDDEQSTQVISSWEDGRVTEATGQSFVAIKIDAKSETCVQFSEIYPVVCIPSSFFIGDNGIPLEVIAGSVPAAELVKRIEKVKQMHAQRQGGHGAGPTPPPSVAPETATPQEPISGPSGAAELAEPRPLAAAADGPAAPAASKESLSRPVEDSTSSGQISPAEESSASLDDASAGSQLEDDLGVKVERLTKKLEERREQRRKGEEENEIQKEFERRRLGKEMLDYKRKREGENTKRMLEERNREKAEEKAARERVKQQIALDRAERAARYTKTKEEMDAAKAAALQARQAELDARKESSLRERSAIARIQFRLPDGSFFTNQFPSESRLEEARQFAAQEVGNKYGNFSLATMFPRREFTGDDFDRTLLELELAPSASVVLLPTGRPANTVVQASGGGLWAVLGTLFYPLLAVWRFLSSFLLSSPPPAGPSTRQAPQPSTSAAAEPKRETVRKRVLEKRTEDFKKDGKIYRLRTQEDNEDDNNTWNGNSTQQM
ncbi:UBX domain-containing protein 4 isoform X2 [Lepisosteus oculatus]|uniref:UBX domain-containing protein 4 isoform X2 n=1 Tax=Lepisosteus oculatus TaxID=7918 RepID=UPI0035F4FF8A